MTGVSIIGFIAKDVRVAINLYFAPWRAIAREFMRIVRTPAQGATGSAAHPKRTHERHYRVSRKIALG